MVIAREDVPLTDRWNVEALYPNKEAWNKAFQTLVPSLQKSPLFPQFQMFQGKLAEGPTVLKEALDLLMQLDRELNKLYTYAHLRHDEDIANPDNKVSYEQIVATAHAFSQETAWFSPEVVSLSDEKLSAYLKSPILADYQFFLEKMVRVKKHTLSEENEKLMALAGQAMQTSYKAFNAMCDADFKFIAVQDGSGNEKPLSHATFGLYLRDQDRVLRKNAFQAYHKQYMKYENTLCELLTGQVQSHVFGMKARNYTSSLEAALFSKNIDTSVYNALVEAVNEKLPILHRYMELRKKILGVSELHLYDVYVPLLKDVDMKMSYEEAEKLVIESVAPLGKEYQDILAKGLREDRWVDRYENQNKRSGAYSSGCYDSMPYILMNYKNILRDVFTLAHEAGHSMHSYLSHRTQPYQYGDYPIFLAEVASTFNEDLLTRLMLSRCTDKQQKIFLINQQIEDIRATLFRQTMFAEFERLIHELVERNQPLTPQLLKEEYRKLNAKYFGPAVVIDDEIEIEWARIPHFYYNFYVYQYATGISAAIALSEKVNTGSQKEREDYLNFLKSGSSKYPIDILKLAGVDMTTAAPVKAAIEKFDRLLTDLETLI